MPLLSTGRKAGVLLAPLSEILAEPHAHLAALGEIKEFNDLYQRLHIQLFVVQGTPKSDSPAFNNESKHLNKVEGMHSLLMEYTVQDVIDGKTDWTVQEISEFSQWLKMGGVEKKCRDALREIEIVKQKLADTVDALSYSDIDPHQDVQERFRRASIVVDVLTKGESDLISKE